LFDETIPAKSIHEAIPAAKSEVLDHVLAAAVVDGDSAFPVAPANGRVLLGKAQDITALGGRIVAVAARKSEFSMDYYAYLKRLGKQMPGVASIYYLENVGQSGEGEFVQFPCDGSLTLGIPIVEDIWKVLGTVFA
jgi:hypothetical protein